MSLKDLNRAYDIALLPPHPEANPTKLQKEIEWAYKVMDTIV